MIAFQLCCGSENSLWKSWKVCNFATISTNFKIKKITFFKLLKNSYKRNFMIAFIYEFPRSSLKNFFKTCTEKFFFFVLEGCSQKTSAISLEKRRNFLLFLWLQSPHRTSFANGPLSPEILRFCSNLGMGRRVKNIL